MSAWITQIGPILLAIAAIITAGALIVQRRTESKSAERAVDQDMLDARNNMLDRYERRTALLEQRVDAVEAREQSHIRDRDEALAAHRDCQRELAEVKKKNESMDARLRVAEARIFELGG